MENTITGINRADQKHNYHLDSESIIDAIPNGEKPKMLMHVCCGPCFCFPLTYICPHFELTIYYNNSNIYPKEEYDRRLEELKKVVEYAKRDYGYDIKLIVTPYEYTSYIEDLRPYSDEPEGFVRCQTCYRKRMSEAYDYAEANGFDYFCTVMTISRHKNAQILNRIGAELEKQHKHTKYFYSDFKKDGGQEKGRLLRIQYDLYNQDYCGCEFSIRTKNGE